MIKKIDFGTAILSLIAAVATLAAVILPIITHNRTEQSVQNETVEFLSLHFDTVDTNMQYEEALAEIYNEYRQLSNENIQLTSEVSELKSDAENFESKIGSLENEIYILERDNESLRTDLDTLDVYHTVDYPDDEEPQQEDNMHSYDLIANLDFFTVDPPAHENGWIEDGELRFWDTGRQQDNEGTLHASGGIFAGNSGHVRNWRERTWSVAHEHSVTYLLNADYSRFTGIIALSWDSRDTQDSYEIRFWNVDDSSIIYTSPVITGGTRPISFDIDVTGIEQLRIERLSPAEEWDNGLAEIGILDARFHR